MSLEGFANHSNLRQEPFTSYATGEVDVVFQPNRQGDEYLPLIDDNIDANIVTAPYYVEHPLHIERKPKREEGPYFIRGRTEQVYVGCLTVIGLFILFRMIQKSKA